MWTAEDGGALLLVTTICAEKWLTEVHPERIAIFLSFRNADMDYFAGTRFSETVIPQLHPNKWWNIMELKKKEIYEQVLLVL